MISPRYLFGPIAALALFIAGSARAQGSPPASQDRAAAQALFERGLAAMEGERYDEACPLFADSVRVYRAAGALFTLAECEAKRGRIATAVARYGEYLAFYESLPPDKKAAQQARLQDAQSQKASLEAQIPRLTLVLPASAVPGTVVTCDGQTIPRDKFGVALPLDPGEHLLTTTAPGGPTTERRVPLARGETRTLELEISPTAAVTTAPSSTLTVSVPAATAGSVGGVPAPRNTAPGSRRAGAYIAGGVGLAGVAIGAVSGGLMLASKSIIATDCKDGAGGVSLCTTDRGVDAGNRAKTLGIVSSIGWGAGIAGLSAAAILWFTEPRVAKPGSSASVLAVPSRRWLEAASLVPSERGAMVRIQGSW